jgi:hypothetical protein
VRGFGAAFVAANPSPLDPTDVFYVQRS